MTWLMKNSTYKTRAFNRSVPLRRMHCAALVEVDIKVEGMSCSHCTDAVKKALEVRYLKGNIEPMLHGFFCATINLLDDTLPAPDATGVDQRYLTLSSKFTH
jgi:hypothetical protein